MGKLAHVRPGRSGHCYAVPATMTMDGRKMPRRMSSWASKAQNEYGSSGRQMLKNEAVKLALPETATRQ